MPTSSSGLPPGVIGVRNVGNTCFASSVLQCIGHCPPFIQALTQSSRGGKVTTHLKEFLANKWSADGFPTFEPSHLLDALKSRPSSMIEYGAQNDAHEFLIELIDAVEEECRRKTHHPRSSERTERERASTMTPIQSLVHSSGQHWSDMVARRSCDVADAFYGQHVYLTQCSACSHISASFDVFTSLPLNITSDGTASVQHILDESAGRAERMDEFVCDKCHARGQALREHKIFRSPDVLLVHVMRFGDGMRKDARRVHVDETIDISANTLRMGERGTYDLRAVVCHRGKSLHGGHYNAVCMLPDGSWADFDDESVRRTSLRDVPSDDVYVLFYERRTRGHERGCGVPRTPRFS